MSQGDILQGQQDYCCQLDFFASSRKLLVELVNRTKSQFLEKRCIPYLVLSVIKKYNECLLKKYQLMHIIG